MDPDNSLALRCHFLLIKSGQRAADAFETRTVDSRTDNDRRKQFLQDMRRGQTFLKVHRQDDLAGYPPAMLIEPSRFQPELDSYGEPLLAQLGIHPKWGALTGADGTHFMFRKMVTQSLYGFDDPPELQFTRRLVAQREDLLRVQRADARLSRSCGRDLVIRVELLSDRHDVPAVWRRIRVSGRMPLCVLHDKVLAPAMGWTRHYHGYYFTEVPGGALFGPERSGALDAMHIDHHGFVWVDDTGVLLGELVRGAGDRLLYTYDLGDCWQHLLTVEEAVRLEESNGATQLLAGALACPPEDSLGCKEMGMDSYCDLLALCVGGGSAAGAAA